jgi:N-acetylglucosamine kinase
MAHIVVGVDGGGTKTECVALDQAGLELGRATGGPSNQYNVALERAMQSVLEAITGALEAAGQPEHALGTVCLSMAGADLPQDVQRLEEAARRIIAASRILVCNDAEGALVGGIGRALGVVIIAGTDSIAYGINARGTRRRAGGWGHVFGDEGSAYLIGREAVQAVLRAHDGRGEATLLADALCAHLNVAQMDELLTALFSHEWSVTEIAALAPVVVGAARQGDAIACQILTRAAEDLGWTAAAVIRGLQMERDEFEVALVGGVFRAGKLVREPVQEILARVAPRARCIAPRHDPATGAALMALQALPRG